MNETDDIDIEYLEPEAVEEEMVEPHHKSGVGFIPVLGIGLVAAILGAVGGAFGAQHLMPKPDFSSVETQIERAIADVKDENAKDMAALKKTIQTLRQQTSESAEIENFDTQFSDIEMRLTNLEKAPVSGMADINPETLEVLQNVQQDGFEWLDTSKLELQITDLKAEIALLKTEVTALEAQPFSLSDAVTEEIADAGLLPSEPLVFPREALLAAVQEEPAKQGFLARTFSKHIKVQEVDGPAVMIEKAAEAYAKGDLRSAVIIFDDLPEDVQKVGQDWREAVQTPK